MISRHKPRQHQRHKLDWLDSLAVLLRKDSAHLRIGSAWILRPQVEEAGVVGGHPNRDVEARPALGAHLARQRGADLVLRLRPSSSDTSSSARERRPWLM
jgi:hypothetical protein